VPAGQHEVDVAFVDTSARQLAWLITGLSAALTLLFAVVQLRRPLEPLTEPRPPSATLPPGSFSRVAGAALAIILVALIWLGPAGWLHYDSSGDRVIPATNSVSANFGDQISLLGFDAPITARPGETIEVTLYWKAQHELDINFQVFLHLLSPPANPESGNGLLLAQSDKLNPGEFPTRRWPQDKYIRDTHRLTIPDDVSPGTYPLAAGLWVQAEGWRLPLLDEDGVQIGDHFVLQYLQIED
jgi:hypothetical protein